MGPFRAIQPVIVSSAGPEHLVVYVVTVARKLMRFTWAGAGFVAETV